MNAQAFEDYIASKWLEGIREAYLYARGMALGRMEGARVSSFDSRGLHYYSHLWGGIHAMSAIVMYLKELEPSPSEMEKEAQKDAADLYRKQVLDEIHR